MYEISEITNKIICGNVLEVLRDIPDESVDMCMTSPPYWQLRDYGIDGQLGNEKTQQEYVDNLCAVFSEVKRVLKKTGTCWVNIADSYAGAGGMGSFVDNKAKKGNVGGIPKKSLCGIPERFAIAMTDELGFIRRNTIIWQKNNVMPTSVKDRFTTDFEYLYFFTKSGKYYFEQQFEPHLTHENRPDAIIRNREYGYNSKLNAIGKKSYSLRAKRNGNKNPDYYSPNGRNKRCVWKINTKPFKDAHFATYPELLCDVPIKAGCPQGGVVLDPFMGSGTTGVVSAKLGRSFIGVELNPEYAKMAEKRIEKITSQKALF